MKFSEMKSKLSGLPEGYSGMKAKYTEIREAFQIVQCCLLREPQLDGKGDVVCSPTTGKPYFDYGLALQIVTDSNKEFVVRTNSPKLISVFRAQLAEDAKADEVNRYGAEIFTLEPPEGKVRFCEVDHDYKSKGVQKVAYLEDA